MSDLLGIVTDNPFLGIVFGEEKESASPVPTPIPASVDVKAEDMKAMSVNVQNTPDLPRAKVVQAGKRVSGHFTVAGAQEMGENGEDRKDFLKGLGSDYSMTSHGPAYVQEQIAYVTHRFTLQNGGWIESIPAGQPYPNPARGWTWQEFTTLSGIQFLFVDTHFVNKAFNDVPDTHKALRRKNWVKHYNDLAAWLKPRVKVLPTVLVGDFNRLDVKPFTPNMRVLYANGIDKMFIGLPQGWRIKAGESGDITTPSDHPAIWRQFMLDRKRVS